MNQTDLVNKIRVSLPSRRWLALSPILLGVGVVIWLATERRELPRTTEGPQVMQVSVFRAERTDFRPQAIGYGTAKALRTWTAIAEVDGRIVQRNPQLEDGFKAREGQLLLGLDAADYEIRRDQRVADLAQAESQLEQIRLQAKADRESLAIQKKLLEVRANDVARNEKLLKGIAASPAELDAAKAVLIQQTQSVQNLVNSLATYDAQIRSAQAAIQNANANVRSAERDLERTRITCPFAGVLSGATLDDAQYLSKGQKLFDVLDVSSVEIRAQFSIAQLHNLIEPGPATWDGRDEKDWTPKDFGFRGSPEPALINDAGGAAHDWLRDVSATVSVKSGSWHGSFPARVERAVATIDETTRTLGIVVRVDNDEGSAKPFRLNPGTFCEVTLSSSKPHRVFVVPRDSVDFETVLVVGDTGQLTRRSVKVAFTKDQSAAIVDGLFDNEYVVINPPATARSGVHVEPHVVDALSLVSASRGTLQLTSTDVPNLQDSLGRSSGGSND